MHNIEYILVMYTVVVLCSVVVKVINLNILYIIIHVFFAVDIARSRCVLVLVFVFVLLFF